MYLFIDNHLTLPFVDKYLNIYAYPQSDLLYLSLPILELHFLSDRDYRIPILLKWSELTKLELCHPDNANRISH